MRQDIKFSVFIILFLFFFHAFGLAETCYCREVVIYTSVDQVFSEPVLKEYQKTSGVRVKIVYDVEASKTTGLVNRLIAEKKRPKCDVFWNSEFSRTILLKQKGVLAPYRSPAAEGIPSQFRDAENYWTGFAGRSRVLIYNTDLLSRNELPRSIFELTGEKWKGKVALAYPLFGTTATHIAALYAVLGTKKTEQYLRDLRNNKVMIVDGNSVVRDLVVEGRMALGFTDTDDVSVAMQSGGPVNMIYPDAEGIGTLFIPNTVALMNNAPHPDEGRKLIDYLLSREVEFKLASSQAAQVPVRQDVERPPNMPDFSSFKAMDVDYVRIAEYMGQSARFCHDLFVR